MANITIAGRTATIVSAYTLEELEKVERYRPDALRLKDEDGETTFAIGTSCNGSVGTYGISFAEETFGNAKACVTVAPACTCYEKPEDFVVDQIGTAIISLNKVEAQIPDALDEIDAELAAIKEAITVL